MAESEMAPGITAPTMSDFARQGAVYRGLVNTLRDGTFVHAYLISGAAGVGKRTLAGLMARHLLCTGDNPPCGECPACHQTAAGNHPDVLTVRPEKSIQVDTIREVIRQTGEHTFAGGRRVVIIEQAEKMTPGAQNALLKTLEEPLPGTVFLLTSDAPSLLLPTIISRCRAVKLHPWPDEVVAEALRRRGVPEQRIQEAVYVSGGSIGRAADVAADEGYWQRRGEIMRDFFAIDRRSDILRISNAWKDRRDQAEELLSDVEDMIRTLLLARLGQRDASAVSGYPQKWQRMAQEADVSAFAALLDAVGDCRRLRMNQVTWQAVVERLLLRLMEEKNKW